MIRTRCCPGRAGGYQSGYPCFAGRVSGHVDELATVPMPLSVVVGTESPVDYDPDTLLSGWDMDVGAYQSV